MTAVFNKNYNLDVESGGILPVVSLSQYDDGLNSFTLRLFANNQAVVLPAGVTAVIVGKNAAGFAYALPVEINSNRTAVIVTTAAAMTAVKGMGLAEVVFTDASGNKCGSTNISIRVEASPEDGAIEGEADYSVFYQAISAAVVAQDAAQRADDAAEAAESTVAAAVSAWLSEHVDPDTGYVIDDSLTIPGAAADAKATGEQIAELKSAIENMDTGLSQTEKNLMLTLFRAIPFTDDVHEAFNSLDSIWKGQTPTSFSITKSLTGCSIDNQTSTVSAGEAFIATITVNTGYDLESITVTMGGTDISASVVSNNAISIPAVSGNVVITAVATKANYTPVEYIVQSADGAYIDTGYYPKLTDVVECEFSLATINWSYIFSANLQDKIAYKFVTRGDGVAGRTSLSRRVGTWSAGGASDANFKAQLNVVYKFVETSPGVAKIYDSSDTVVASIVDQGAGSIVSEGAKLFLFVQASSNNYVANTAKANLIQLRDFKIKNNLGNVIHHYIPVKDGNDVACLYDTIDKQYLYDGSGNNNFSAGNEVTA